MLIVVEQVIIHTGQRGCVEFVNKEHIGCVKCVNKEHIGCVKCVNNWINLGTVLKSVQHLKWSKILPLNTVHNATVFRERAQ